MNCLPITNIIKGYGHLMISPNQFFLLGVDSNPGNLHMYKITFSSTNVNWANMIAWTGTCSASYSESVMSEDGLSIYLFFTYGSSSYLYFVTLSTSTGSVIGARFKSSVTIASVFGSTIKGDYITITTQSFTSLIIYNLSSSKFNIKSSSIVTSLFGWGFDPLSSR